MLYFLKVLGGINMQSFNKKIVLEDGLEMLGYGFGADKEAVCEIVFNTSMVNWSPS